MIFMLFHSFKSTDRLVRKHAHIESVCWEDIEKKVLAGKDVRRECEKNLPFEEQFRKRTSWEYGLKVLEYFSVSIGVWLLGTAILIILWKWLRWIGAGFGSTEEEKE